MVTRYKTLFEVRIFHEYYLTEPDGTNVFEFTDPDDRLKFIVDSFAKDRSNIRQEVDIDIPEALKSVFNGYHLKVIPTFSGFKALIDISQSAHSDGTIRYRPRIELPNDASFLVWLMKRNGRIDRYTNGKMAQPVKCVNYFSNEEFQGVKQFPFLTNPVKQFDSSLGYEQGELASHSANDVRAFYKDIAGSDQWINLNGSRYASDADKVLVPMSFLYSLTPEDNVTTLDFALKNPEQVTVAQFHVSQIKPIVSVPIILSPTDIRSLPDKRGTPYTLDVSGDNSYQKKHTLIFYNGPEIARSGWALINLAVKSQNSDFNLIDNDGRLVSHKRANGQEHIPAFEIYVKSRLTYWRYINEKKKDFQKNPHGDHLDLVNGKLVSKVPRPMSFNPFFFKKKPDNKGYYLPNPKPNDALHIEGERIFSDVFVCLSNDLFPLGP